MILPAAHVEDVIDGLNKVGALDTCDGVLSGYLGEAATANAVARAVGLARRSGRSPLYLCDPVMGDDGGGLYVDSGLPDLFRDLLLPAADIITPNRFELELLAQQPVNDLAEAGAASRHLLTRGPAMVVTTSLDSGPDRIACLAVNAESAWVVETPMLDFPVAPNGAGDLLSAVLLGHLLLGQALPDALARTVSGVFGVLERTRSLGRRELALAAAQDEITRPGRLFVAVAI
jgi:pyridoxine kinase